MSSVLVIPATARATVTVEQGTAGVLQVEQDDVAVLVVPVAKAVVDVAVTQATVVVVNETLQGAAGQAGLPGVAGADGAAGPPGQGVPAGGTTGQVLAKLSNSDYATEWVTGGGGGVTDHGALTGLGDDDHAQYHTDARGDARYSFLAHGHAISDTAGLQAALDAKAAVAHSHAIGDVTGLTAALAGKSDTGHTHLLANVTDVTMTVANLNALDDGVNTALHFHDADRARANHTGTQLASTISDLTEAAQDAAGAMVDATLVYADATPALGRAAITGHITIAAGSNASLLGSFTMAQLDAAVSDGNVSYVGHTHLLANVTDVTMTVANLNALDDGVNTALHFHDADRARANHTGTQLAATVSDFAEAVDDRVAALLVQGANITLTYNDASNTLTIASTGGGGAAWGSVTGTLSAQTDLQSALDAKSGTGHTHSGLAPAGGTAGQVLKKISATDYDYSWQADNTGGGGGASPILSWVI